MSTHAEIMGQLWSWGHFRNPAYPETHNINDPAIAGMLAPTDLEAIQAIRSYQEYFADVLDPVARLHHQRQLVTDGDVGPATEWLISRKRCGCPDFLAAGAEEANWPDACRHEITVSYDFDQINLDAPTTRQAWQLALASWEAVIAIKFAIQSAFNQTSRIWATDGPLPGSTLAWSELARSSCTARLEQRYDTLVTWNLKFLQSTICHEVGHALGLNHLRTRQSIMYPSITDVVVPQEPDIQAMVQLGYARQTIPPPPDKPPLPGPDIKGLFIGHIDGRIVTVGG